MSKKALAWPKTVFAVGDPEYPDEGIGLYRDGLPKAIEDHPTLQIRRYVVESGKTSERTS
jgi:hypothetical protein